MQACGLHPVAEGARAPGVPAGPMRLHAGNAIRPGSVAIFAPEGARCGDLGWRKAGNTLSIVAETGRSWRVT